MVMAGLGILVSTTRVISDSIMGLAQQEGFPQLDVALENEFFMHGLSLSLLARQSHLS
jgi:hypothetical protein